MKKKIELFQPYLRKHILNFGLYLKNFSLDIKHPPLGHRLIKKMSINEAFNDTKGGWLVATRRVFGIPNIRFKQSTNDLIFTYGTLLITNKPYCTYIENSVALFNYDPAIAKHPIAQYIVKKCIQSKNCKRLIFMSNTALIGFLNSISMSERQREKIRKKCIQCYPLIKNPLGAPLPRKIEKGSRIRFLYIGTFYIKGGLETIQAFSSLKKKYPDITLTVVTGLDMIYPKDAEMMRSTPGVQILEANFSEKELFEKLYSTHDILVYPTYRDGFGLLLVEVMASGLPVIGTDQYATSEMIVNEKNGILIKSHPMKDYDEETFVFNGKYRQPRDFYTRFFQLQKTGGFKQIESNLYVAMEKVITQPELIEKYSKGAISLYEEKFDAGMISDQIESVFLDALKE